MEYINPFLKNTIGKNPDARTAVCLECGHTWIPRNSTAKKPSICSVCKSRNCVWQDELEQVNPVKAAALSSIVNGQGTMDQNREYHHKPATQIPNTADVQKIIEHATKEAATLAVKEMQYATAFGEAKAARQYPDTFTNGEEPAAEKYNAHSAASPEFDKETIQELYDEMGARIEAEEQRENTAAGLRALFGKDIQIIDNPNDNLGDDTDDEEPQYAAWVDKDGDVKYAALIHPEALEEFKTLLERESEQEEQETADEHNEEFDDEDIEDEDEDEELEAHEENYDDEFDIDEDEADNLTEKSGTKKQTTGLSPAGIIVLALGIAGGAVALTYIAGIYKQKKANEKKQQNTENENQESANSSEAEAAYLQNLKNHSSVLSSCRTDNGLFGRSLNI